MEQIAEKVTIRCAGSSMVGRFYRASGQARASVLLNAATGVPQRYYRHFAQWAVQQGLNVLTYDYRDFGESLNGHLKDSPLTMADWMLEDQSAALAALADLAPRGPIWVLGHSLGGLGVAFHDYPARVTRITTIGSGFAHHWDHPWSYRPVVLAFWFLLGPLATALMGYLPGKSLRFGLICLPGFTGSGAAGAPVGSSLPVILAAPCPTPRMKAPCPNCGSVLPRMTLWCRRAGYSVMRTVCARLVRNS